jgi:WD40 repeat protein
VGSVAGILQDSQSAPRSEMTKLRGHDVLVGTVLYSADGRTLVSGGWDKQVRLWEIGEGTPAWGREIQALSHDWHVFSVAMTPDGKYLAVGGVGGFAIWERKPGSGWDRIKESTCGLSRSIAISPDGHTLAITNADQMVRLWDLQSMKELHALRGVSDELRGVEFSFDGALLAASTFGGEIYIWDMISKNQHPIKEEMPDAVQSFTFLPASRTMAIAQWGKDLKGLFLWEPNGGSPRMRLSDNNAGNNVLVVSPDGRTLASADQDESIRLWDLASGKLKATIHDGVGWVRTLAFSPDGRQIAFGGRGGTVQFRNLDLEGTPVQAKQT